MAFDPDAYLASKKPAFDPDAYLASKSAAASESAAPESGVSATPAEQLSGLQKTGEIAKGFGTGALETARSFSPVDQLRKMLPSIQKKEDGGFELGKPEAIQGIQGLYHAVTNPLETAGSAISGAVDFAGKVINPKSREDFQKVGRAGEGVAEMLVGSGAGIRGLSNVGGALMRDFRTGIEKIGFTKLRTGHEFGIAFLQLRQSLIGGERGLGAACSKSLRTTHQRQRTGHETHSGETQKTAAGHHFFITDITHVLNSPTQVKSQFQWLAKSVISTAVRSDAPSIPKTTAKTTVSPPRD